MKSSEYLIKATFLYNYTKFIEWPEEAFQSRESPIFICILGEDPFADAMDPFKDKIVDGRRISIKYCRNIIDIVGCHILFISRSENNNVFDILKELDNIPCLTVSDMDTFVQKGGMIFLFKQDDTISFEINLNAAIKARLKISSRLLKLARIYKE